MTEGDSIGSQNDENIRCIGFVCADVCYNGLCAPPEVHRYHVRENAWRDAARSEHVDDEEDGSKPTSKRRLPSGDEDECGCDNEDEECLDECDQNDDDEGQNDDDEDVENSNPEGHNRYGRQRRQRPGRRWPA